MSNYRDIFSRHAAVWLLLALPVLTLLSLVLVYRVRPTTSLELGDYDDSLFLEGFHAREVDSAGAGREWEWPLDQQQVTVPGNLRGKWIATLYAADGQPDGVFRGLAMSANRQRLTIPRQGGRRIVGVLPADITAAESLTLQLEPGLREGPQPPAGLVGRVVLEPARTYRWSRGKSEIALPGVGRGAWVLELGVVSAHPDGGPVQAAVMVNDTPLVTLPDYSEMRRVRLLVPPALMDRGDMVVSLRANTYADPRPLGVLLDDVRVSPASGAPLLPPWGTLLSSVVVVVGVAGCLLVLGRPLAPAGVGLSVFGVALCLIGLGAWALIAHRFPTTFMLPRLALLVLWSMVLLAVLRPLLLRLFRDEPGAGTLTPDPAPRAGGAYSLSAYRFVSLLLLIFFVGYWLKAGGMLYPYFIGIDVHWHMDRVRWILDGQLGLLYGTNSPLNESTMPLAEWGPDRPVIPYSPYYHIFAASFALLPWSLEMSANMVSALLDSLHVVLIALLAVRGGLSRRAALLAALLYTVLPAKFLLHSWGNVPTTSGLWWTFAATVFLVVAWPRLHRPRPFAVLVLLLIAALLFYTVAGAFMALFLVSFTLLLLAGAFGGRTTADVPDIAVARGLRWLWAASALALLLSIAIYYGQYIGPILERTVPYFLQSLTSSAESMGKASDTIPAYLARHARLWSYGLVMPLLLTAYWLLAEGRRLWRGSGGVVLWAAVGGWMVVTLVFLPLAYKISMVDKHFFVSIPVMAVATAAVFDRLWDRGVVVRAALLLYYLSLSASALHLWLERIVTVKQ